MTLTQLREELIKLRNHHLNKDSFDAEGVVLLSHTIKWLYEQIEIAKIKEPTI